MASKISKRGFGLPTQTKWSGHDGLAARAEGLPPGPSTLEDLYDWPTRTIAGLTEHELGRIATLCDHGIIVYGDYSGMDTYRE